MGSVHIEPSCVTLCFTGARMLFLWRTTLVFFNRPPLPTASGPSSSPAAHHNHQQMASMVEHEDPLPPGYPSVRCVVLRFISLHPR